MASAAPQNVAVSIWGTRLCHTMYDHDGCPSISLPRRMSGMAPRGMSSEPHRMFAAISMMGMAMRSIVQALAKYCEP